MREWAESLKTNIELYLNKLEIVDRDKDKAFELIKNAYDAYMTENNKKLADLNMQKEHIESEYNSTQNRINALKIEVNTTKVKIQEYKNKISEVTKKQVDAEGIIYSDRFKFWKPHADIKAKITEYKKLIIEYNTEIEKSKKELNNKKEKIKIENDNLTNINKKSKMVTHEIYANSVDSTYFRYMNSTDLIFVKNFFKVLFSISCYCMDVVDDEFNIIGSTIQQFKYLLELISITKHSRIDVNLVEIDDNYSIVAKEKFKELQKNNSDRECEDNAQDQIDIPYLAINSREKGKYLLQCYSWVGDETGRRMFFNTTPHYLLKKDLLNQLLDIIEKNPKINLPSMALLIANSEEYQSAYVAELNKFKELYEETPEQILVTEQRYYQQKKLEQAERQHEEMLEQSRENARLERERRDEQARLDRQMAIEQAREDRMQQERIAQRQADQERQYQEQEYRRQQAEASRRDYEDFHQREREKQEQERARRNAHQRCLGCAYYGSCHSRDIPGCGAFRPK